jgi:hypothetical protein
VFELKKLHNVVSYLHPYQMNTCLMLRLESFNQLCKFLCPYLANYNDSEQTRVLLTSAAYVHLKHADVSKYIRNLSPASRAILLSGPAG